MASSENEIITVESLSKRFGDLVAVDGISFGVKQGEIFGILGPNGAGKTTTLECVEGLLTPTNRGSDKGRHDRGKANLGLLIRACRSRVLDSWHFPAGNKNVPLSVNKGTSLPELSWRYPFVYAATVV